MSITIYGASDDLIEVEGDVDEEFSALGDDEGTGGLIVTNLGDVVQVAYDRHGIWRITPLAGSAVINHCLGDGEGSDYSDRCVIEGDVEWVVFGSLMARRKKRK